MLRRLSTHHLAISLGIVASLSREISELKPPKHRDFFPEPCTGRPRREGTTYFAQGPRPGRRARSIQRGR